MNSKLFTLDEANRVLPLVRSITRDAVSAYRAVKAAIRELDRLNSSPDKDLEPRTDVLISREIEVEDRLRELRGLVEELDRLGCRLRDYERGVVDFPAAAIGESGFLVFCWALGEGEVLHWHSEHESYPERRLLPVAVGG